MYKAFILLVAWASLGCGGSHGIAGTYKSQSGLRQIILNSDGTFRLMYGERTSPADLSGTYSVAGDSVTLKPAAGEEIHATRGADGITVGTEKYRSTAL